MRIGGAAWSKTNLEMLEDFGLLLPLKVSAEEVGGIEKMGKKQKKGSDTNDGN